MPKAVVVLSGGLDSTTLLYRTHMIDLFDADDIIAVSFNYGQRHKKELDYAKATCERLGLHSHHIIDLYSAGLTDALVASGSSLVDPETDVPEGSYDEESMKATVVPNRNMIMLSIAGGIAVANGATRVYTGVHAGDHAIYPDCRPQFINAANAALVRGNEGFGGIPEQYEGAYPDQMIFTPYLFKTKAEIAYDALCYGVPLESTWSCYKGGEIHCGRCGTCVERLEAINEAQATYAKVFGGNAFEDNTQYEDSEFWKEAVAK